MMERWGPEHWMFPAPVSYTHLRLEAFEDEVIVERLTVLRYLFYALCARHGLASQKLLI